MELELVYTDGSTEKFNIDDYTKEELADLLEQIVSELHKRDFQDHDYYN